MTTVVVQLEDLAALAQLVSDLDSRTEPPSVEKIDECHGHIMKMMGEHAGKYYDAEDSLVEASA